MIVSNRVTLAAGLLAAATLAWCVQPGVARAQTSQDQCLAAHAEAQRHRLQGRLLAARAELLTCAQRECPDLVTSDCTMWLTEVESSLSSVVLAVEGAHGRDLVEVRVLGNGRLLTERADGRALPLDPGPYEFRFEAEGYAPLTISASIRQSEKNRILRVRLAPEDADAASEADDEPGGAHPVPVWTYVLGGVSLASFGTAAYFGLSGRAEYDDLSERCAPSCTPDQVEPGKRAYTIANVALGVGIASAAAAAVMYFVAGGNDAPAAASRPSTGLQAGVTADGAYLQWTSRH